MCNSKKIMMIIILIFTGCKIVSAQSDSNSHIGIGLNINYNYLFLDGGPLDFLPLAPTIEIHFMPTPKVDISIGAWYYFSSNGSSEYNDYGSSGTNSIFVFNGSVRYILLSDYKNSPFVGLGFDYASFPEMAGISGKFTPEGYGVSAVFGGRFRVSKFIQMYLQANLGYSSVDARKSSDIFGSSYNASKKSIFSLTGVSYGISFVF